MLVVEVEMRGLDMTLPQLPLTHSMQEEDRPVKGSWQAGVGISWQQMGTCPSLAAEARASISLAAGLPLAIHAAKTPIPPNTSSPFPIFSLFFPKRN